MSSYVNGKKSLWNRTTKTISSIKNNNILNNYNNYSQDKLLKKEDIIDSKLKFKSIFERINKNTKKFNSALLSNLEQKERKMEKIISLENLLNFIYQSGIPYNLDLKKNEKQVIFKEKINPNFDQEKIDLGAMDYFSLDTFSKGTIKRHILNRKNEEHLMHSKNFKIRKSGIPEDLNIYTAKNILRSINFTKNRNKNRLFEFEKNNSKVTDESKNNNNSNEKSSINNYFMRKTSNSLHFKNEKSGSFKSLKHEIFLANKSLNNTESKKLINIQKLKTIDNSKKNLSEGISKKIIGKKTKKNIRLLLLDNNNLKNIKDKNLEDFKISIKDLNQYNNKSKSLNSIKSHENNYYTKEEKINLEKEKFENLSKNLGELNSKIRNVINNYNFVMNKRSLTERSKKNNFKIIKMFSSLGRNTINNMATDLGFCQNHIQDKLLNVINDLSFKKENIKQLDPTLEIILDTKIKNEEKNQSKLAGEDDFDYLKAKNDKDFQRKEIDRLGELIGKINSKVAFDLSSYLIVYNKNLGKKIEGMQEKINVKKRNNNIKYLKKSIESQIYNMKQIKQRNLFDYNKIMHKFNDFYTKIHNEKKINEEYKKLFLNN